MQDIHVLLKAQVGKQAADYAALHEMHLAGKTAHEGLEKRLLAAEEEKALLLEANAKLAEEIIDLVAQVQALRPPPPPPPEATATAAAAATAAFAYPAAEPPAPPPPAAPVYPDHVPEVAFSYPDAEEVAPAPPEPAPEPPPVSFDYPIEGGEVRVTEPHLPEPTFDYPGSQPWEP